MAQDINHVVLVGRLTRDAQLKFTNSGLAICTFAIAVNRMVKQGDKWTDEAHFFDITLFGKLGEALSQYLLKGQQVAVEAELRQDRWEQDGQKRSKVVIIANALQLLGGKPGNVQNSQPPTAGGSEGGATGSGEQGKFEDSDIPF